MNGACLGKIVKAEPIEDAVWGEVEKLLLTPNDVLMKLGELDAEGGRQHAVLEAEKLTLDKTIADKECERARVVELYRRELISMNDVERQMRAIKHETEVAKARLAQVEHELSNADALKQRCVTIEDRLAEIRGLLDSGVSYEVKRQIVELLVSQVKVTTIGEGRDRHIDAEVVFAIDRNALCSGHTDISVTKTSSKGKLPPIVLKMVTIHGLSA
jgi:site-specific DNA recombinase